MTSIISGSKQNSSIPVTNVDTNQSNPDSVWINVRNFFEQGGIELGRKILLGSDFDPIRILGETKREIFELVPDNDSQAILSLIDFASDKIGKSISHVDATTDIFRAVLLLTYLNIIKGVKNKQKDPSVTLTTRELIRTVLFDVVEFVHSRLDKKALQSALNEQNVAEQQNKLNIIFGSLVDGVFEKFGIENTLRSICPARIVDLVISRVKEGYCKPVLVKMCQDVMTEQPDVCAEILQRYSEGKSLVELVDSGITSTIDFAQKFTQDPVQREKLISLVVKIEDPRGNNAIRKISKCVLDIIGEDSKSGNSQLQPIWSFGNYLAKTILTQVCLNAAKNSSKTSESTDVKFDIAKELYSKITAIILNGSLDQDQKYEAIVTFVVTFIGLNKPHHLGIPLLSNDILQSLQETAKNRLKEETKFLVDIEASKAKYRRELATISTRPEIVQELENVIEYVSALPISFAKEHDIISKQLQLNEGEAAKLWQTTLQNIIEVVLLQVCIVRCKNNPELAPAILLNDLISIAETALADPGIKTLDGAEQVFANAAQQIMDALLPKEVILPLPPSLQQFVREFGVKILGQRLGEFYSNLSPWFSEKEAAKEKLEAAGQFSEQGSHLPHQAIKAIARVAEAVILDGQKMAGAALQKKAGELKDIPHVAKFAQDHQKETTHFIQSNVEAVRKDFIVGSVEAIGLTIAANAAKTIADKEKAEAHSSDLLTKMVTGSLRRVADHVGEIVDISEKQKQAPHVVADKDFQNKFKDAVFHPALADPENLVELQAKASTEEAAILEKALKAGKNGIQVRLNQLRKERQELLQTLGKINEKDNPHQYKLTMDAYYANKHEGKVLKKAIDPQRKNLFFDPIVKKVLAIAGIPDASHMPGVTKTKELEYQMAVDVLSKQFRKMFDKFTDQETILQLMLSSAKNLGDSTKVPTKFTATTETESDAIQTESDAIQQELDIELERVMAEVVKVVIPDTIPESILKNVAKKMGGNVRGMLKDKKSILHIVNEAIDSELPKVLHGEWITKEKDGKNIKEFVFTPKVSLPKTKEERLKLAIDKEKARVRAKDIMTEEFVNAIDVQIRQAITSAWGDFQENFDKKIASCPLIGPLLKVIKSVLDKVFRFVFITLILNILLKPVTWAIMAAVRRFARRKLSHISDIATMPVHKSLYYHLVSDLMEKLVPTPTATS